MLFLMWMVWRKTIWFFSWTIRCVSVSAIFQLQFGMLILLHEQIGALLPTLHDEFVELWIDRDRVVACETREAEMTFRLAGRAHHSVHIQIANRIRAEIFADLIERALIRDEIFRIGKID